MIPALFCWTGHNGCVTTLHENRRTEIESRRNWLVVVRWNSWKCRNMYVFTLRICTVCYTSGFYLWLLLRKSWNRKSRGGIPCMNIDGSLDNVSYVCIEGSHTPTFSTESEPMPQSGCESPTQWRLPWPSVLKRGIKVDYIQKCMAGWETRQTAQWCGGESLVPPCFRLDDSFSQIKTYLNPLG